MVEEREDFLWVEKYRPATIEDCVLPKDIKQTFLDIIEKNDIPNLLLSGPAGVGKTTVAKALCEHLNCDYIMINGSDESGIDVLRTKIKNFASTVSLSGGSKIVILDEADYLNPQSTQPALRSFMEEFSGNCRFIMTCNYKNKIISPLHSRCSVIDFRLPKTEKETIAKTFFNRIKFILGEENIKHEEQVIVEIIMKHFPDFRRTLNELQKYSLNGDIDVGILSQVAEINIYTLMEFLKKKEFTNVRKWVVENLDNDPTVIFRKLYDSFYEYIEPTSIMKLGDYLKAINYTKEKLMDTEDESVEKEYPAFVVNRCLSYFVDTIAIVNEMNQKPFLSNKLQFDFLLNIVRSRKRFKKWDKSESPENLETVKEYYEYSNEKAQSALDILSDNELTYMRRRIERGG